MQTSLSRILARRLNPTGKLDDPTIAAILYFKNSRKVPTKEYYAGPIIEQALLAAGASPPPPLTKAPCSVSGPAELVPLLQKHRGDIPVDFLLGWIEVESGRQLGSLTSICERGYFQLHPEESSRLGLDHDLIGTNADYSVAGGIALVAQYRRRIDALSQRYRIPRGSDLYWRLVKLCHWIPTAAEKILSAMARAGIPPAGWDSIRGFASKQSAALARTIKRDPIDGVRSVDHMFKKVEAWRQRLAPPSR